MQSRKMSMSGAVDLGAVKAAAEAKAKAEQARAEREKAAARGEAAGQATPLAIDVTEETFERDVLQRSAELPVIISFWAEQAPASISLGETLERLAGEYAGRFVVAKADVYANQMLFQ